MSYFSYDPVLSEIRAERTRQDERWGEQNHADGTGCYGEHETTAVRLLRDAVDAAAARGESTWRLILSEEIAEAYAETDPAKLRAELVQVAAVAVAWIEALDRRTSAAADAEVKP